MPGRKVQRKKPQGEQQPGWLDRLLGRGKPKEPPKPPKRGVRRRPPTDVIPEP